MGIELWKEIVIAIWIIAMIGVGLYYSKKQTKIYKEVFHIDK